MVKIGLNIGHGGKDVGATNGTLYERDVNKKIVSFLAKELTMMCYHVETFQQTSSVNEVVKWANNAGLDYLISIHCNSFSSTSQGHEVLYYPTSTQGKKLAQAIQISLVKTIGLRDRGVKSRNNLAVLNYTKMPTALVETAFISNPNEAKLLKEKPDLFAKAIAIGIQNYLKS